MEFKHIRVTSIDDLEWSEPEPEACESCWNEWNARHGHGPEDDDHFTPVGSDEREPQYDPNCLICVANYEKKLALWRAKSIEAYA